MGSGLVCILCVVVSSYGFTSHMHTSVLHLSEARCSDWWVYEVDLRFRVQETVTPADATQLTFILVLHWLNWEAVVFQAAFSMACSDGFMVGMHPSILVFLIWVHISHLLQSCIWVKKMEPSASLTANFFHLVVIDKCCEVGWGLWYKTLHSSWCYTTDIHLSPALIELGSGCIPVYIFPTL